MVFVKSQKCKAMKSKIEKHIKAAMKQIDDFYNEQKRNHGNNYKIPKEYKGYLSSLGASILMSGILPTLAVYYSKESKAERKDVINWVCNIIQPLYNFQVNNDKPLLNYAISINNPQNENDKLKLIEDILNVSVALKLSIRTFPLN